MSLHSAPPGRKSKGHTANCALVAMEEVSARGRRRAHHLLKEAVQLFQQGVKWCGNRNRGAAARNGHQQLFSPLECDENRAGKAMRDQNMLDRPQNQNAQQGREGIPDGADGMKLSSIPRFPPTPPMAWVEGLENSQKDRRGAPGSRGLPTLGGSKTGGCSLCVMP